MDEKLVRKLYDLLNHELYGVTEVMVLDQSDNQKRPPVASGYFDNVEDLVREVQRYDGKYCLYIGVQPRRREIIDCAKNELSLGSHKAKGKDISAVVALFLDIDVARDDKSKPATDAQVQQALTLAHKMVDEIPELKGASIIMSGNGAQMVCRVNINTDLEHVNAKLSKLVSGYKEKYSQDITLKIDNVQDLVRFMCLPGTKKVKGTADTDHPHRDVVFITGGDREPSELLRETVLSQPVERLVPAYQGKFTQPEKNPLCPGLQKIICDPPEMEDRSEFMIQLVAVMKYREWSPELIREAVLDLGHRLQNPSRSGHIFHGLTEPARDKKISHWIETADTHQRLSCRKIQDLLGGNDCQKTCPFRGGGKYPLTPAPDREVVDSLSLDEARVKMSEDIQRELGIMMEKVPVSSSTLPGGSTFFHFPNRKVLILRYPPGAGKNHILAGLVKGMNVVSLWFTPRLKELEKLFNDLGGNANIIRAKGEVCSRKAELEALRKKGYFHREQEFCHKCRKRKVCPFPGQFDKQKTLLMSSSYLATGVINGKHLQPELIVLDEGPLSNLIKQASITANDLAGLKKYLGKNSCLSDDLDSLLDSLGKILADPKTMSVISNLVEVDPDVIERIKRIMDSQKMAVLRHNLRHVEPTKLPPYKLYELLEELAHDAEHQGENSRLSLKPNSDDMLPGEIEIRKFHALAELARFPIIVMDSGADPEIYRAIFPYHEINVLDCEIENCAEVVQITNAPMGKKWVRERNNRKRVAEYIRQNSTGKVGIICHKENEKYFHEQFPDATVGHYRAVSGSRNWEDCDCLFLVGGAFVGPDDLLNMARAIFYRQPVVHDRSNRIQKDYGMVRDNHFIYGIYEYEDPRMGAVVSVLQDEEMRQAAGRIRPLDGSRVKKIYILSNVPVPGLRPDRLERLGKIDNPKKELFMEKVDQLKTADKKINVKKISSEVGIGYKTGLAWLKKLEGTSENTKFRARNRRKRTIEPNV